MTNSFSQIIDITCAQCKQRFSAEVWLVVDATGRPDLVEQIIHSKLSELTCPVCGSASQVDGPLLLYRPAITPALIFSPAQWSIREQDQDKANDLLGYLRQQLGVTWQEAWVKQMTIVPREALPIALQYDLEAAFRQEQLLAGEAEPESNLLIPPEFQADLQRAGQAMERYQQGRRRALNQAAKAWENILGHSRFPSTVDRFKQAVYNDAGEVYLRRYWSLGKLVDLERALELCQKAVTVTPPGSPQLAAILNNLGNCLNDHYALTGKTKDLEAAIANYQQAAAATPPGSPQLVAILNNLGNGLRDRYTRTGVLEDLEESIRVSQQAVTIAPPSSPELAMCLNNLGNGLRDRYARTGALEDLEESILVSQQAVTVTPPDSPELASYLNNLGTVLRDRYDRTEALIDLEAAMENYRQATQFGQSVAWEAGLRAARSWGDWAAERKEWSEAVEAYQTGLQIAEELDSIQLGRANREQMLQASQGLTSRCAYALACNGQVHSAVEVLESGRARLLREALERKRIDLIRLEEMGYANLYERYQKTSQRWESLYHQTGQETTPELTSAVRSRADLVGERKSIQDEINALVEEIRAVPGYAGYLRSLSTEKIQAVAIHRPLVYLLAAPSGGLALLVQQDVITSIWLDRLTESDLREQIYGPKDALRLGGYSGAYANWRANPADPESHKNWSNALEVATHWLWEAGIDQLNQTLTARNIQRIVLIPSDLLGLLPLQAAWHEDPIAPTGRCYAIDTIHFTYAPSAHAFRTAMEQADRPADNLLAVDNPDGSISFAGEATAAAISHFDPKTITRLEKAEATPQRVKEAMKRASVMQFYTHGIAGFDQPLDGSSLLLTHGAHLTLREILELKLEHARLAFLAACETGIPGMRLLDEVVSLPTGFLQAGVPGVIGSQWFVADISTMLLVTRFYDLWKGPEATLPPPEALRQAQIWLRDSTNHEIQAYLKSSLPAESGLKMLEDSARVALDHLLLEDSDACLFAHPYYWAAFEYTGI